MSYILILDIIALNFSSKSGVPPVTWLLLTDENDIEIKYICLKLIMLDYILFHTEQVQMYNISWLCYGFVINPHLQMAEYIVETTDWLI